MKVSAASLSLLLVMKLSRISPRTVGGSPQVDRLAVLRVHLIEVPSAGPHAAHAREPLPANIAGEHRTEPALPMAHRFVTDVHPALEQQILDN